MQGIILFKGEKCESHACFRVDKRAVEIWHCVTGTVLRENPIEKLLSYFSLVLYHGKIFIYDSAFQKYCVHVLFYFSYKQTNILLPIIGACYAQNFIQYWLHWLIMILTDNLKYAYSYVGFKSSLEPMINPC